MKEFLMAQGWYEGDMVILTDEPWVDPYSPGYPSGHNILRALRWLVDRSGGHSLFLHYSGHGGQVQSPSVLHPPQSRHDGSF
jgi:metacaspase-1